MWRYLTGFGPCGAPLGPKSFDQVPRILEGCEAWRTLLSLLEDEPWHPNLYGCEHSIDNTDIIYICHMYTFTYTQYSEIHRAAG